MSVRPGLRAGLGLIALSAAHACSGALVSRTPGLDHTGSRVEEKEYEVHAISRARVEIIVFMVS